MGCAPASPYFRGAIELMNQSGLVVEVKVQE